MASNVMQAGQTQVIIEHDFSWFQKYVLRRSHPRSIFIDTVGLIWFTYYFWNHNWKSAVGVVVIARVIALASVINVNTDVFAKSTLGKIGLLHLNPFNLVIQLIGMIALLFGIWDHSTEVILGGLSVVLLGHVFGWSKVDDKLADVAKK